MVLHSPYEDYDLYSFFLRLVRQIPEGKVSTYREIAAAMGDSRAAAASAYMQATLASSDQAPFHRLIRASGELGGYRTLDEIRNDSVQLREEGITVTSGRVKFIRDHLFDEFETDYPLQQMKDEQVSMAERVSLEDDFDEDIIGAVDVSYDGRDGFGVIAFREDGEYIIGDTVLPADFPYIPGYLFYREYRFIKKLAINFDGTLLIDGNGLIHPRYFGLASASGVYMNKATVGVAKTLLLGKIRRNWVIYGDRQVGYIAGKHTIISPGHRISLESSVQMITDNYGKTYPDILKVAHNGTVSLRRAAQEKARMA